MAARCRSTGPWLFPVNGKAAPSAEATVGGLHVSGKQALLWATDRMVPLGSSAFWPRHH
jgi:hypothetical protein